MPPDIYLLLSLSVLVRALFFFFFPRGVLGLHLAMKGRRELDDCSSGKNLTLSQNSNVGELYNLRAQTQGPPHCINTSATNPDMVKRTCVRFPPARVSEVNCQQICVTTVLKQSRSTKMSWNDVTQFTSPKKNGICDVCGGEMIW